MTTGENIPVKIVLASRNKGKAQEIERFFAKADTPKAVQVLTVDEVAPAAAWTENGDSFEANALIKAKAVALHTSLPVLADDSGLCVDILNGKPGIHSARFFEMYGDTSKDSDDPVRGQSSDALNNHFLLSCLSQFNEPGDRKASFICVLAFLRAKSAVIAKGTCSGRIAFKLSGTTGFGYDPLFVPDGYEESLAVLGPAIKSSLSHRAVAFKELLRQL